MWWAFPSGGVRSAVRYARDVRGAKCHFSAHAAMALSLADSFSFLIEGGSAGMSVAAVVRMALSAFCLALRKPEKWIFFGSHCRVMAMLGCEVNNSPNFSRCLRDAACSSCADGSSTLASAVLDERRILKDSWVWAGLLDRRVVMASRAGVSTRVQMSVSVTSKYIGRTGWVLRSPINYIRARHTLS